MTFFIGPSQSSMPSDRWNEREIRILRGHTFKFFEERVFREKHAILKLYVSTGVSVAGVDTVGRPGLASGTGAVADCARLS
jgi:hypothetical protein